MTQKQFDEKWKDHLEKGHYGLAIDNPLVTEYLDNKFTELKEIYPEFTYAQIKLKFDSPRVYMDPQMINTSEIEKEITRLLEVSKVQVGDRVVYSDGYKFEEGVVKELKPCGTKAFIVYHCNDDWDNYADYTGALTKLSMINIVD